MTVLDIIILILLVFASLHGMSKGFISQVGSLIALFAGAWVSFHFSEMICNYLSQYLEGISQTVIHVIGYVLVFLVILILFAILARIIKGIFKLAMLGWLDKLLGAVLAIITTGLLIGIALILFNNLNTTFGWVSEEKISESVLFEPIKGIAENVFPYLKALLFKNG